MRHRTALGPNCALATGLLLATGMRVGELAALRIGDIDAAVGHLRILGKGSRERTVFVTDRGCAKSCVPISLPATGPRHRRSAACSWTIAAGRSLQPTFEGRTGRDIVKRLPYEFENCGRLNASRYYHSWRDYVV